MEELADKERKRKVEWKSGREKGLAAPYTGRRYRFAHLLKACSWVIKGRGRGAERKIGPIEGKVKGLAAP